MPAFIAAVAVPSRAASRRGTCMCAPTPPEEPKAVPPRDPGKLRSASERARNQPARPLRRRRRVRGRQADDEVKWEELESVPLVRRSAEPESGEDYWVDLGSASAAAETKRGAPKPPRRGVNASMRERLRRETVAPYEQNWGLWVLLATGLFALAFKLAGGFDAIPIIPVPDL